MAGIDNGDLYLTPPQPYTVSGITREIKSIIEGSFPPVWVQGEISNYTHHVSGHRYFTLKDELAQLRCVMWKWSASKLRFTPMDGMRVLAYGEISVYERGGIYQLVIYQIQPAGIGELQLAYERLKRKLASEGLFDESRKKPIPAFPRRVGVVTSPTGAAIRDIVKIIGRRAPDVEVILWPARVQGDGAAEEIATGLDKFNEYGEVDLIIVGRGGGSIEDLWAFNEEIVARAISRSRIPVISAVGHEIDFTIADFVADRRAPTPSAAAEIAVRDRRELVGEISSLVGRARSAILSRLEVLGRRKEELCSSYAFRRIGDRLKDRWQRLDELENRMFREFDRAASDRTRLFKSSYGRLRALDPSAPFRRGFSICVKLPEGKIVTRSSELSPDDRVKLRFLEGSAICEVESTE